jgi:hypothetical protein
VRYLKIPIREFLVQIGKTIASMMIGLILPLFISMMFASPDYGVLLIIGFISLVLYCGFILLFGFTSAETTMILNTVFPAHKKNVQPSL